MSVYVVMAAMAAAFVMVYAATHAVVIAALAQLVVCAALVRWDGRRGKR